MQDKKLSSLIRASIILIAVCGMAICLLWVPMGEFGWKMGDVWLLDGQVKEFWAQIVFHWIVSLPCFYLLWLAWKTFRRSGEITDTESRGDFLTGFTMQFVNPKVMLYGLMSYEAYILPSFEGQYPKVLGFAFVLSTIGFVNGLLWSAGGSAFKWVYAKYGKTVNAVMALALCWCALKLIFS